MAAKILYVVNNTGFFFSHRLPLAHHALENGYEVHLAAAPSTDAHAESLKQAGIIYHPAPLSQGRGSLLQEARTLQALFRLYRRIRPDLVHHVGLKQMLYGGIAARLAGVSVVVDAVTGLGYAFTARGAKARMVRSMILRALRSALRHERHQLIVQNPDDRDLFIRERVVAPEKVVLIKGSGVDMNVFLPAAEPQGRPVIVLASRMLWDKGVGEFVEAARLFRAWDIGAKFVLAGDTDAKNPSAISRGRLEAWNASGTVEWRGHCSDMPDVYAEACIACLPSYYREGVPKSLIEAAASGRPIVTTDEPGCREIVRNAENGLLVPSRDARALADALKKLIDEPSLRREMGARGRRLAEAEFSLQKVVQDTFRVYQNVLTRSGAAEQAGPDRCSTVVQ